MTERWEALEAALVCMRDPLSRIQLAASQIADAPMIGGCVGQSIQQAVGEIDLRIEDTLTGLRRGLHGTEPEADVRESLARVVRDLGPVLVARGIDLVLLPLPDTPVCGDESLVRRIVCRLLLGVGRWIHTRSGVVEIGLVEAGDRVGIRLDVHVHGGECGGPSRDILGPTRGFALGEGLSIEGHEDAAKGEAMLMAYFSPASA